MHPDNLTQEQREAWKALIREVNSEGRLSVDEVKDLVLKGLADDIARNPPRFA
jgi:hypothetical protein